MRKAASIRHLTAELTCNSRTSRMQMIMIGIRFSRRCHPSITLATIRTRKCRRATSIQTGVWPTCTQIWTEEARWASQWITSVTRFAWISLTLRNPLTNCSICNGYRMKRVRCLFKIQDITLQDLSNGTTPTVKSTTKSIKATGHKV